MKCPKCQARMYVRSRHHVLGKRYGKLPGVKRLYVCPECGAKVKTQEIRAMLLEEQENTHEEQRQGFKREIASLKQKIYWLTQPEERGQHKLQKVREGLIKLIERTF